MKIQSDPPLHLTYCLNVHPGESWEENLSAIRRYALAVRDRIAPHRPFGLGLRLSHRAAATLQREENLAAFAELLAREDLYVFTINGFPYGTFHGQPVKQEVYRPDWRTDQRRDYTLALAGILARLLPAGMTGSISTVPVAYGPSIAGEEHLRKAAARLAETAAGLADIRRRIGKDISLGLEPEPDCLIESTDDALRVLPVLTELGTRHLVDEHGIGADEAREAWDRHIGVCLDTAHAAVQFEDPREALGKLRHAGIRVAKIQLSAALALEPTPSALRRLAAFAEPVYLHQVKARRDDGGLDSFPDLPAALAAARDRPERWDRWRVHFHVPLFFAGDGELTSTAAELLGDFAEALRRGAGEHLEIETYTFTVLPRQMQVADLAEGICREYQWVLRELLGQSPGGQ